MVLGILEERKNMTRRVMKPQPWECPEEPGEYWWDIPNSEFEAIYCNDPDNSAFLKHNPFGNVGDVLWVRETFFKHDKNPGIFHYVADYENPEAFDVTGWKKVSGRYMPKEAARLFLKITDIRVQRLQNITEEDSIREGVYYYGDETGDYYDYMYDNCDLDDIGMATARESFKTLWQSINNKLRRNPSCRKFYETVGEDSWELNPWVWVISFDRCEKPEGF